MKKLTLAIIIGATMSTAAIAGNHGMKLTTDFNELDTDGNGQLTTSEFKDVKREKLMGKMNTNSDDVISRSEFDVYVTNNPGKFSDDVVTTVKAKGTTDAIITRRVITDKIETSTLANEHLATEHASEDLAKVERDTQHARMKGSITNKFEKADSDDDGTLSEMEVANANIDGDFSEMDRDDNQLLTKMEFRDYITKNYMQ